MSRSTSFIPGFIMAAGLTRVGPLANRMRAKRQREYGRLH